MSLYKKKKLKMLLSLILIFSMYVGMVNIKHIRAYENEIKSCDNYIIYYGYKFNSTVMKKLKTYDLVIINPLEEDADEAREALQDEGIKVYGYISSAEIPKYDSEFVKLISSSEKLKVNDTTLKHWEGNELGDLRIKSYRSKVINLIGKRIVNCKYDGVFIDTIDDLENIDYILDENKVTVSDISAYKNEMINAGVEFIKELKNKYSEIGIIQNRGFEVLQQGSKSLVDGILYEDICKSSDIEFFNSIKNILDEYTNSYNGVVMTLPNNKKYYSESRDIAEENKWLYYETENYDSSVIADGEQYRIDIDDSDNHDSGSEDTDVPDDNIEDTDKDNNGDNSSTGDTEEDEDESGTNNGTGSDNENNGNGNDDSDEGDKEENGSESDSEDDSEVDNEEDKSDTVEDTMTEKERAVAEKAAVTKIKANLSPITKGRVPADITDSEIIDALMEDVQDGIVKLSIEDVSEKAVSRSFKIHVKKYLDDTMITSISAKIIYE